MLSKLSNYTKVAGFLALEILAIIAFGLGNSYIFFTILGAVLSIASILVVFKQIKVDGITSFAFFLFPLVVYGLLALLSSFTDDPSYSLGNAKFIIPFCLLFFAVIGYALSINKDFKIKHALVVIYSAIALITVINLLVTMIEFVPFHTVIYKNKYMFYDGAQSELPVSEMAFALMGFKFTEVSIKYFSLFPTLLLSAFVPLFFIKFKEDKKLFVTFLVFGCIGFVSLLVTPTLFTILTDILVIAALLVWVAAVKLHWDKKFKIFLAVLLGLAVIVFIIVLINAQGGSNVLTNLIKNNSVLNRLFNTNKYVKSYNEALLGLFSENKLFGCPSSYFAKCADTTNSWFIDNFLESGLFGSLFFIMFLVIGIRRMIKYYRNSEDQQYEKVLIFGFVISFFAYSLINFDCTPFAFNSDIVPMYESGMFLTVIVLMAYCFGKSDKLQPVEPQKEANEDEEVAI